MSTPHRIIVIGATGQLARALLRVLPQSGATVTVLARPGFDLEQPHALTAALLAAEPHVVVNAAAYTAVDKAEDEPARAHAINAVAPGVIAAAAAQAGAAIIHVSTDYVFDGTKRTPYVETDPTAPLGVYGASKLAGEQAVTAANPAHVILRTAWVCSPDGANFVKTMLRLGAERARLGVVDDQHGAPTFAVDLARAIAGIAGRLAVDPANAPAGVFHLTGAGETTWCGFARAIMAGATVRGHGPMATVDAITTAEYPTRARRPSYSTLATGKITAAYGIVMPPWEAGLAACLDTLIGPPQTE
jgi:dTDP-4-dehydrorhamnose reductase